MTRPGVPRLHLIGPLAGVVTPEEYPGIAGATSRAANCAVHVRLPGASGGDVLALARAVQAQSGNRDATVLIVNDRVDVAMLVGAAGIHLGERSLPVADARRLAGEDIMVGRSVHDVEGALRAEAEGADYVIAGHIFETESKRGQPGRGLSWLEEVTRAIALPVIAIGGVNRERVSDVLAAGAWGIGVGRELLAAADPATTAREIAQLLVERQET